MLLAAILPLFLLPISLAASVETDHTDLIKQAKSNNGVIVLDERSFYALTNPKRTWSASIQFTAMDSRRRCVPCKEFDPAWNAVAAAWSKVPSEHRDTHFFGTLDFDSAQTVFQSLGIMTAPLVSVYPAAEGPRKPASGKTEPFKYDFTNGFDAEPLANEISRYTSVPIPYSAPINWTRWGTFLGLSLFAILSIRFVLPILRTRLVWIVLTVIPSLAFISGYMFTQIRGAPWSMPDGQWMAGGNSNQLGKEVEVLSFIYGGLAACFLGLILVAPSASPTRQKAQVYVLVLSIMFMYSSLLSLFRFKNRGYPFKLFFS